MSNSGKDQLNQEKSETVHQKEASQTQDKNLEHANNTSSQVQNATLDRDIYPKITDTENHFQINPPQPDTWAQPPPYTETPLYPPGVYVHVTNGVHTTHFRRWSVETICPNQNCRQRISTVVKYESGDTAMCWGIGICCFVGIPCAFIPCCMDDCKDALHFCPVCNTFISRVDKECCG